MIRMFDGERERESRARGGRSRRSGSGSGAIPFLFYYYFSFSNGGVFCLSICLRTMDGWMNKYPPTNPPTSPAQRFVGGSSLSLYACVCVCVCVLGSSAAVEVVLCTCTNRRRRRRPITPNSEGGRPLLVFFHYDKRRVWKRKDFFSLAHSEEEEEEEKERKKNLERRCLCPPSLLSLFIYLVLFCETN